jgi:hypothetical protein
VGSKRLDASVCLIAVLAVSLGLVSTASAAFPGRDGVLAERPLHGNGIVLVGRSGRGERRICTKVSLCGHPGRPQFSPDGRSIVFAGPAIRLVGTDGICQNCRFGVAAAPAFRGDGTLVTFASGARVFEDGIDGIRQTTVVQPRSLQFHGVSDAVWSVRGTLAVAAGGRMWIGRPGVLRSIGRGSSPSWSADGSRVAFVRRGWIIVRRVSGGASRRVVRGTAPAFSPNGRSIAFVDGRHRLEVISSSGGEARPVGRVRGLAVDWQPLPAHPARCVPPLGAGVIARSSGAVVTAETGPPPKDGELFPATAVMGCLTANGRERVLDSSMSNNIDGATDYPTAALGGTYAGVVAHHYDEHYPDDSSTVDVFDLRTGARSGFGGESDACDPTIASTFCGIDQLVVGRDGVSAAHVDSGDHQDALRVSCASTALCVAYNGFGDVSASTDPSAGPWSSAKVATFRRVSCPSTTLCVGVDGSATVYVSTNPIGGSSTWTKTQIPGVQIIWNVSCPSTTLCVASASGGKLLVSIDPTAGPSAWSVDAVDGTKDLLAVSCPTTSECFAAAGYDGDVISSSNPTGGASAWTVRHLDLSGFQQISCPSSSLCMAAPSGLPDGVLISTDPVAGPWTTTDSPFRAVDVSCPSTSLCVAVNGSGVSVSTDPSSGEWTTHGLSESPLNVSCPTTSFCAIGTAGGGNAFTSSDPAAGTTAWKPVLADPIDCATTPFTCATEQIIAADRTGVHTLDSSTEYQAQTGPQLTGLALNGDTLSWNAHGSPTSAQLRP